MADLDWWGEETAHHIPDLSTMKSACGLSFRRSNFTRFDTVTGLPWPRCARCIAKLASQQPPDGQEKKA